MIVSVDLDSSFVALEEPADCARFHVAATGAGGAVRLDVVLAANSIGRMEADDAFIDIDALRLLAAGRVDDTWDGDFAAMLDFARTKGWLDAAGSAIQAHVEWVP